MTGKKRESWIISIEEFRNMAEAAHESLEEVLKALHSRDYSQARELFETAFTRVSVLNAWMHDSEDTFLNEVE